MIKFRSGLGEFIRSPLRVKNSGATGDTDFGPIAHMFSLLVSSPYITTRPGTFPEFTYEQWEEHCNAMVDHVNRASFVDLFPQFPKTPPQFDFGWPESMNFFRSCTYDFRTRIFSDWTAIDYTSSGAQYGALFPVVVSGYLCSRNINYNSTQAFKAYRVFADDIYSPPKALARCVYDYSSESLYTAGHGATDFVTEFSEATCQNFRPEKGAELKCPTVSGGPPQFWDRPSNYFGDWFGRFKNMRTAASSISAPGSNTIPQTSGSYMYPVTPPCCEV